MSIFTLSSALAALPVLPNLLCEANSYSSFKILLKRVLFWKAFSDPLRQLIVPSFVFPQLFIHTSIMLSLLRAILFVSPTTSLRTRTNYLIRLCIPKT